MSYALASELRRLRRDNVRLNRKLALHHLEGVVAERDPEKWKVRLELAKDEDGQPVLSPWLKPHANSSGAYKDSPALPAVGDRMRMHSPSGVVGGASYAIASAFDDEVKRPDAQDKDEHAREFGKTRVSQTASGLTQKTEETSIAQSKDKIVATAKEHDVDAKTNRQRAESREKFILVLGGQEFNLHPTALVPA